MEGGEIKYTILYRVCEDFCDSILLRFRSRSVIKLRFRFRNTANHIPKIIMNSIVSLRKR